MKMVAKEVDDNLCSDVHDYLDSISNELVWFMIDDEVVVKFFFDEAYSIMASDVCRESMSLDKSINRFVIFR